MNNILGKRIKNLRENEDISQKELAKKLNISNSTLSQYENGIRVPSDEIKILIANHFNVSIDYLLGKSDIRNPYITVDTNEKANDLSNEILDLLVEMGEISEDEIKTGSIDDKKANELLDKIKKAIKVSQIFKE